MLGLGDLQECWSSAPHLTHLDLRGWCCSGCDPIIVNRLTESWTGPKGDLKVDGLDSEESDDQSDWEDEERI
jgi:hypothetical protein